MPVAATGALAPRRRRIRLRSPHSGARWAQVRPTSCGCFAPSTPMPRRSAAKVRRMSTRKINVGYLARVEGEGAVTVRIRDGAVTDVKLRIFEPPRFFEALLRGRRFDEAPDITARICGICP